jgi:hypothetical protein
LKAEKEDYSQAWLSNAMHLYAIKELMINLGFNKTHRESYTKLKEKID